MGLEQGKWPELIRYNSDIILRAGTTLIESATTATELRSAVLPDLVMPSGMLKGQSLFVVTSPTNGGVVLGMDTRKGTYVSRFSWHVYDSTNDPEIGLIEPKMDTFFHEGVGIGRAIFKLGIDLLHKIGPTLPKREVFAVIKDGSLSRGRHGWTTAAMEMTNGYEKIGDLHSRLNQIETGDVFIRKLK